MPFNFSGNPDPNNYVLGRGRLLMATLDSSGNAKDYRDVGNCSDFSINREVEDITHESSTKGSRKTDKRIILSNTLGISFTLDEVQDFANLAAWLSGTGSTKTNLTSFSSHTMITAEQIPYKQGSSTEVQPSWYKLIDSSGDRAFDIQDAANLTIQDTNATPVSYVLDTDYKVDLKLGYIQLLDSTKVRATKTAGDDVDVALSATGGSSTLHQIDALTNCLVIRALVLQLENPADSDHEIELFFPRVSLAADGDAALISEEFSSLAFTGVAEPGDTGSDNAGKSLLVTDNGG